jgi:serine/threonine-protein kinase ATR
MSFSVFHIRCLDESHYPCVTFSRDGLYQQAYTYILNAEKFHLKELFVEKAKLYWEKGEQDPAFLTLRRGLEEYFPIVENPEPSSSVTCQDDSKICAEVTHFHVLWWHCLVCRY